MAFLPAMVYGCRVQIVSLAIRRVPVPRFVCLMHFAYRLSTPPPWPASVRYAGPTIRGPTTSRPESKLQRFFGSEPVPAIRTYLPTSGLTAINQVVPLERDLSLHNGLVDIYGHSYCECPGVKFLIAGMRSRVLSILWSENQN